jgi:iron complex transport system substrate-binding protein
VAIEEIIRLHPDVVFTHHGKRMEKLNALGIPTFCLSVESPEALIKGIQLMGRLLGQESRAEEVVTYYKSKLSWIRQQTRDITRKKQVYFAGPTMLSTSGGDRYQHFLIQAAGGVNVAKANRGGWSGITIEQLISWNPEVIIVARYGAARPDSFVKDLRFREIQAVKKGQVLQVPSFIFSWDVPTPESLLGIMWLANTLYPNRVTFDLNNEIKSFYSKMYDYTPSQAEIDSILAYESNE